MKILAKNIENASAVVFPPFLENFHPKNFKIPSKLTPSPPPMTIAVRHPPHVAAQELRPPPV
jgi:hypothetical protein